MTEDIISSSLLERMRVIFEKIPKDKWKYFHKKSFENFVYYLPNIHEQSERSEIEEIVTEYLNAIDFEFDEIDIQLSQDLHQAYLLKLIKKYDLKYSFVPVFGANVALVFVTMLAIIFYILRSNICITTVVATVVILYVGRIIVKLIKGKVYGFRY